MKLDAAFRRAWGRPLTRQESERIGRLREAFDIGENDAFLTIAAVLEFYDGIYRQYPDRCAEAVAEAFRKHGPLPSPGSRESATGSGAPAPASSARDATQRELRWIAILALAVTAAVLVGVLGMAVGATIQARGALPCWAPTGSSVPSTLASVVLRAPAGWIVLLSLWVPACSAAAWGWTRGRNVSRTARERGLGWAALVAVGLALPGWLLLLSRL